MTGIRRLRRRRPAGPQRPPWAGPLGLYHAGSSWLHRLSPGVKAAGLAVTGLVVVLLTGPAAAGALLLLAVGVAVGVRLPLRSTVRGLAPVLVTAALVGLYQWWQRGAATGFEVAADLVTLVLAATTVTATTRADR